MGLGQDETCNWTQDREKKCDHAGEQVGFVVRPALDDKDVGWVVSTVNATGQLRGGFNSKSSDESSVDPDVLRGEWRWSKKVFIKPENDEKEEPNNL